MTFESPRPPEWQFSALCVDFTWETFFPEMAPGKQTSAEAKAICDRCPVKAQCLAWELAIERAEGRTSPGIYGGTTQTERQKMRKERACGHCGALFASSRGGSYRYCSEDCAHEAHLAQRRVQGAA